MVLENPMVSFAIGVAAVVLLLVWLKLPAFVGLILAAMAIGVATPAVPFADVPAEIAQSFGDVMVSIGIPILMAAIIGKTLMDSGAADRIVRAFLSVTGEGRSEYALLGSSYVLSIPVFFDNVFYLLAPLGRSMKARTGIKFSLYVSVLAAGALATHMLVPPTPGPLAMAAELNVDLGLAIVVGSIVALPASILGGVVYGRFLHGREDFPLREAMGSSPEDLRERTERPTSALPGLLESSLPIVVPVVLIASNTVAGVLAEEGAIAAGGPIDALTSFLGDPNFALTAAALLSAFTFFRMEMAGDKERFGNELTEAIKSGGNIIAITAAGGTFGAMLAAAGVGEYIAGGLQELGLGLLVAGWLIAAVIRVAQGSGTVAILTGAAIMAPLAGGFAANPVYLMMAVGFGGMIAPWYNDSGFWIISEVAGLTQMETFKTYSAVATVMSVSGLLIVLVLSALVPL
ncbi:GntP family permease [Halalkalicoccus sp. NIPERK01]|uniref:GntP family permease n=1 Tax=Halalkalicoccus sp. NIPERK01 TaxID=3053469 RepID=UPI00256ED757|nr:SLC13 family permease [Halalkalicoccus sp. NIPERK01]MDL5362571.1 SLC13 family permease [Halalkalicoccus sp. NIPERK01]